MSLDAAAPSPAAEPRHSCIYRGRVSHRRRDAVRHAFRYRLFMAYLDLDELDAVFDRHWLWSTRRFNLAWFRRGDYLGDPDVPLRTAVADAVEREVGRRPGGPIRVLTNLRYLGWCFNPVTFYYCFDAVGDRVEAVVAEITNTPWGERHAYALAADPAAPADRLRFRFAKRFHVSPFFGMDHEYDWTFTPPGERLVVRMHNRAGGERVHDAVLALQRREIGSRELASCLLAHPFMTGKVVAAIYWQALRLKWKGAPFHAHPRHRSVVSGSTR